MKENGRSEGGEEGKEGVVQRRVEWKEEGGRRGRKGGKVEGVNNNRRVLDKRICLPPFILSFGVLYGAATRSDQRDYFIRRLHLNPRSVFQISSLLAKFK